MHTQAAGVEKSDVVEQPLLSIENLSITFTQGEQHVEAVKNATFSIMKGEIFALVGESGSGKSVTAAAILRLLPSPMVKYAKGQIWLSGESLLRASENRIRTIRGNEIGMIFQEPMMALNPLHTLEKQISEVLILHQGMNTSAARARCLELLDMVKLPDPQSKLNTYPNTLSGGQRQRVMIAMALANNPKLLIADEPTTALDVTLQQEILSLLQGLQQRLGMSILLITHDLNLVRRYADRVAVMAKGEILEVEATKTLFSAPKHSYTQALLAAHPKGGPIARSDEKLPPLLTVAHLKVWFPKRRGIFARVYDHLKAVNDISFSLEPGKTLGIVGESGSGKSTLGLALLRLIRSQGEICFGQTQLSALNSRAMRPLRAQIQMVFQDPFASLSPRMLVGDIIKEGLRIHRPELKEEALEKAVIEALEAVELTPQMRHRYPHEFSGGQRQRIAIARALILHPQLIVLDEPTSALDRAIQVQITELLKSLQQQFNLSYLFISHDLGVVRAISHELLVMHEGVVVESGPSDKIFNHPEHPYTRKLLEAALLSSTSAGITV